MIRNLRILVLILAFAGTGPVAADTAGKIKVSHPWARASVVKNGAAYLTIENHGSGADKLVAVSTPAARKAELHTHMMDNDIVRMRKVAAIEVSPGTPTVLRPGGLHIMMMGLKRPLKEGGTITLTLTFEKAGPITVVAPIRKTGAMKGYGDVHDMNKGHKKTH